MLLIAVVVTGVIRHRSMRPTKETIVSAACALGSRQLEARVAEPLAHRPFRARSGSIENQALRDIARDLFERWRSDPSIHNGRLAGLAFLLLGEEERAATVLVEAVERAGGKHTALEAIRECRDAALLIDFSAAMLGESSTSDPRRSLLALEAADAAQRLHPNPAASWNRALAAERLGLRRTAVQSWRETSKAPNSPWSREAAQRLDAMASKAAAPAEASYELFFHVDLISEARAFLHGQNAPAPPLGDAMKEDRLALDTRQALERLRNAGTSRQRERAIAALDAFSRGRASFLAGHPHQAFDEFSSAERELDVLQVPIALLARDQRIRAQCWRGETSCLENIRSFRTELDRSGRYPWLAARAAFADGQANYRAGRIYDAAESMMGALTGFERVNDAPSANFMHSLLGNAFAAAGESDLALTHYVAAIRGPVSNVSDRRRKQLEDPMMFMLRHGYVATAEAILDELADEPSTEAALVMESTLRGVLAVRRGETRLGSAHFDRARDQLQSVRDQTSRAEVQRALVIAEAGSGTNASQTSLHDLDGAVSVDEQEEISIWLPQLLTQRGITHESRREWASAERDYRRAIDLLERREPRIDQTMLTLGIAYGGESPFDRAIRLLLQLGRFSDALAIADRAARLRVSALHAWSAGVADVFDASRTADERDAVPAIRRALRPGQTAVAYHLFHDELVTWVVTPANVVVVRRGARADDLRAAVKTLRECAASSRCPHDVALNRVSDILVGDWIERTPRHSTLLLQQPPDLPALPFAMLRTRTGERVLERNAVTTAPSLLDFARAARHDDQKGAWSAAFFAAAAQPGGGRSPLPAAISEVTRASRAHFDSVVDTDATRARFLARAPAFSVVHFAGHVVVNDEQPLMSALVFNPGTSSESQMLHMHELTANVFSRARLVVLAACETGRTPRPTMSIANALLSQGIPS
ncbi:MAG TPA: CHAT domain-containing protein, partial [Thermoanaerobaculia bacterium]|nr:CHAT domain-containing protein [Thermoanaerobaculia bacterium]